MPSILVTGAASGAGEATARKYAANGYDVLALDFDKDGVHRLADELPSTTPYVVDLSDLSAVAALGNDEKIRNVDVLLNNAGRLDPLPTVDATPDDLVWTYNSMLIAPHLLARIVMPAMHARRSGVCVYTGSFYSLIGKENGGAYGPAKGGLLALVKCLGLESARYRVRHLCMCPAHMYTPLLVPNQTGREAPYCTPPQTPEQRGEGLLNQIPLRDWVYGPQFADAVWDVVHASWAQMVTGSAFTFDGGLSAGLPFNANW